MKWNLSRNQYRGYNIYSMKKYVDKKRIIFTVICILVIIISLGMITFYSLDTIIKTKRSQEFVAQLIENQNQIQEQIKKAEEEKIAKFNQSKENIENIYSSETKKAYLTFDDGPSKNTKTILDTLNNYNIKATFFVLGSRVDIMPEMLKEIKNQGSYIANHGYSHVYQEIYSSKEAVLSEYNKTETAIKNALEDANFSTHLFRFPGGSKGGTYAELKNEAKALLTENQILTVDWNALTGDSETTNPTPELLMENLKRTIKGKNSIVVLMHDSGNKKVTADTLPQVIEYLKNEGYEFKTFYDEIQM